VSFIGKAKTMTQMLALIGLLAGPGLDSFLTFQMYWVLLGKLLLYIAAVLSIWSMVIYTVAAWKTLLQQK
jgi:CDP-diacylglycerol--glycerol-3-phosphate 3-phosphatidyltransferase